MKNNNVKRWRSALTLASWLASWPTMAGAEPDAETICVPKHPTRCVRPLSLGEPAPFTGLLLTDDLALYYGQAVARADAERLAAVTATAAAERAQARRDRLVLDAQHEAEMAGLRAELEFRRAENPWYTHPVLVGTVTAILATAFTVGVFKIATEVARPAEVAR